MFKVRMINIRFSFHNLRQPLPDFKVIFNHMMSLSAKFIHIFVFFSFFKDDFFDFLHINIVIWFNWHSRFDELKLNEIVLVDQIHDFFEWNEYLHWRDYLMNADD